MPTKPMTVTGLLASLPEDRRRTIKALRTVIRKNLDPAFRESIQGGMLSYVLPHSVYPDGYHCDPSQPLPYASVASQKHHVGLYLFCVYCEADGPELFRKQWLASGKKLDMGKSCVRVKTLEDIPLDVVGRAIKRVTARKFVKSYEAALPESVKQKRAGKLAGTKRPASRKASPKQAARKKVLRKKAARRA